MTKRFNLLRFAFASVQANPASDFMIFPSRAKTQMNPPVAKRARNLVPAIAVLAAVILLSGGWYYSQRVNKAPAPLPSEQTSAGTITNEQLEAQYGIRVTLIAVTAMGGIVDFRYKVVEPQKAAVLLQDPTNKPILTALDSGFKLSPTQMGKHHSQMRAKRGAVPFTFYPNVRSAVKPGTPVVVSFGDVSVGPIIAQ